MNIQEIAISDIRPDPDQPRKTFEPEALERLTQSIRDNGIEQPIIVRKNGAGYVIIDGERRWRAAKEIGIKTLPSIMSAGDGILEKQLRSDCLKEGLMVDELDRAIYRYYENGKSVTSDLFKELLKYIEDTRKNKVGEDDREKAFRELIGKKIGKSYARVIKAIDRFEFKQSQPEFTKQIELKHGKDKYGKVNSTIAMTDKLKSKPEVRKATIKSILEDRDSKNPLLDNEKIKKKVNEIAKRAETPRDVKAIFESMKEPDLTNDPRHVFSQMYFKFNAFHDEYSKYEFEKVKDHVRGDRLNKFIKSVEQFLQQLKDLGE